MEQVLNDIEVLQLNQLDDSWVEGIYYSDFLEFGEIPTEYESVLESVRIRRVFDNIMKSIRTWLADESEEKSWASLSGHVPHKKLLSILGYHIDYGTKNVVNREDRNNALLSARLYFKLLSIPGFKAYHLYHSQLFANSLACLNFPKAMCDKDDYYSSSKELAQEVNSVIKLLSGFVQDLSCVLEQLQLGPTDMNFEDILSNMLDITGCAIITRMDVDKVEYGEISKVIYQMIDVMVCDSNKQPETTAIKIIFKCLLPKLIATFMETKNANANIVRASYVTYAGLLLSRYGKAALTGFTVLLEHLCYTLDGLERAEIRTSRANLVLGLMSFLPRKSYKRIVAWILKLSETAKVAHRQIALELLANLLNNEPEDQHPNENYSNKGRKNSDSGNEDQTNVEESNCEGERKTESNETLQQACQDESSQDTDLTENVELDMADEEAAGLLSHRTHTVPYAVILRAVYERLHDVSSTLRARALTILTECLLSEKPAMVLAIQEISGTRCMGEEGESGGVSRLVSEGARAACDERAVVRRAAAALLHRLATTRHTPTPTDLALLVSLCRDASIIVRSAAIAALGEMVADAPNDVLIDAFLTGPFHQLSDPENKVQDQVLSLTQQMLIDRIKKAVGTVGYEDQLPWTFLSGITRHNMRRHLQKACALLSKKNNSISVRLVDALSTHLGSCETRDLSVLVMLTSAARYVDYSNIEFVMDYYYKLAADYDTETQVQKRDTRLMALTLELLALWSRFATNDHRTTLRDHIVKRLATSSDDGCRIAAANLAAQLDPNNLQWANELLQLAERRCSEGGGVGEWLRAADLSLVAPHPPSPAVLRALLAAIDHPPPDADAQWWGECVAGAGRVCVRSRAAASDAAPRLAALLHADVPHTARLNALLALTDICGRYTCIVEPLLGSMCGCLETSAPALLRRAAVRALTRLLLAGYLRLRTPLYYRFCALLADEDHDVREPAEYYITCCLTADAIYHHFVDCVLYYNNETTVSLSFDSRQLIYDVMLQRLSLVQKLNVQCRLAREVLEHAADVVDEGAEIPPALHAALLDTITLLCGPRMKLPKKPDKTGDTADIDDLQERVTTNIVSHKMKRTVAEVLVPAVLRLYARLRSGQVAAYLVRIANDLLHDYRQEIEELIENDEELVKRVQHFQETIGLEPSFGNARNLVTSSNVTEPETPRAQRRRRAAPNASHVPRKRALHI